MNKERAINILIAHAVCCNGNLFCDEHCPNYKANREESYDPCEEEINDILIKEAVLFILANK